MTNELQRHALEHSRLGIPLVYGVDAVHGHNNVLGATIYPHNLGLAATWNPDLAERVAQATARDVRATGIHWTFAPVADLGRDLRWGRFYETFGEDPLLAGELVAASVRGFQGGGVAATAKHFIGYGVPEGGRDRAPASIPERALRELHLPPFVTALDAGARTVMANSGAVNGVPVHASHELLTGLLRDELGFGGVVVSDWHDIHRLVTVHRTAPDFASAVETSINAGIDLYMVPHDARAFTSTLLELVREGRVSEARIDEAVTRILTLKFELGLFERPYVDAAEADAVVVEEERGLAYEAAVQSLTLLEHGGVLPLQDANTILVAGPSADSVANQMGGWTIGWQGVEGPREAPPAVTILAGLQARAPNRTEVRHLSRWEDADAVAAAAREADVAVLVLGEAPYAEGQGDSDTAALEERQARLVREVAATGTPTVVVLVAGRPLMLPETVRASIEALLMAYLPGSEGGSAVADVLYGHRNPSGRLPFSWPQRIGQLPLSYDLPPHEAHPEPLYPFGYGLSYTRYAYSRVDARLQDGSVVVTVEVANAGERPGTETVQLYVRRPPGGVLTPLRQLVAFAQVTLEPGEARTVTLELPLARLGVYAADATGAGAWRILPGEYAFELGGLEARLTLAGEQLD
jgi:beta-glucosidase